MATKKKTTKKSLAKKRVAAKSTAKKTTAKKKKVAKKTKVASKKPNTKKKTVVKKKTTAKKKVAAKKKVTTKKKASPKKAVNKKTTTKKKTVVKSKAKTKTKIKTKTKAAPKVKTTKKATKKVTKKTTSSPTTTKKRAMADIEKTDQNTENQKPTSGLTSSLGFKPYEALENESYMNAEQRDHFRGILMQWKSQLMQEVDSTVGHMKEEAASYPDPIDRAAQEEGFSLELRTRDRERKLIKKIEQSLDDIDNGVYGYCEDCGAEIGVRRLEARPTATKCIDCKTFEEIREKQTGV